MVLNLWPVAFLLFPLASLKSRKSSKHSITWLQNLFYIHNSSPFFPPIGVVWPSTSITKQLILIDGFLVSVSSCLIFYNFWKHSVFWCLQSNLIHSPEHPYRITGKIYSFVYFNLRFSDSRWHKFLNGMVASTAKI